MTLDMLSANSRITRVALDGAPTDVEGWVTPGDTWNGWENPYISRESIDIVLEWINAEQDEDNPGIRVEWEEDCAVVYDLLYPEEPPVVLTPVYTFAGDKVYPFLTWGYCWFDVSKAF